jgi:peptidoglycan/LPS O-acetylase OafA/YrhL
MTGERDRSRSRRLSGLDGLRALAATLVVVYHVGVSAGRTGNGNGFAGYGGLAPVLSELKSGVTIFFVISGLVLYLPFARAVVSGGALPDWRAYTRRRIVRIVPAYWVALLSAGILLPGSQIFGASTWRLLTFAQIYHADTFFSGLGVAWSLDVEVAFYIAVPILAAAVARLLRNRSGVQAVRGQIAVLGVLGIAAFAGRVWLSHGSLVAPVHPGLQVTATLLPMVFGWFVPGMILAVLIAGREAGASLPRPVAVLSSRPAVSFALALCIFAAAIPTQHGDMLLTLYSPMTQLLLGLGAMLLVLPVALRSDRGRRGPLALLDSRPLVALGTVSFGIYLWHQPLLFFLRGSSLEPSPVLSMPATLGLSVLILAIAIAIATVSWHAIERPLQNLARRTERPTQHTGTTLEPQPGR